MVEHWEEWKIPDQDTFMFHGEVSSVNADKYLFPRSRASKHRRGLEVYIDTSQVLIVRMTTGEDIATAPTHATVEEFIAWCRMVDAMNAGGE